MTAVVGCFAPRPVFPAGFVLARCRCGEGLYWARGEWRHTVTRLDLAASDQAVQP